jgi:hypothetical protein
MVEIKRLASAACPHIGESNCFPPTGLLSQGNSRYVVASAVGLVYTSVRRPQDLPCVLCNDVACCPNGSAFGVMVAVADLLSIGAERTAALLAEVRDAQSLCDIPALGAVRDPQVGDRVEIVLHGQGVVAAGTVSSAGVPLPSPIQNGAGLDDAFVVAIQGNANALDPLQHTGAMVADPQTGEWLGMYVTRVGQDARCTKSSNILQLTFATAAC